MFDGVGLQVGELSERAEVEALQVKRVRLLQQADRKQYSNSTRKYSLKSRVMSTIKDYSNMHEYEWSTL